ncbi:hypothetical protein ASPZODRAFT_738722 [Penicilliopsis zonata CBS 506.65]|uniref:Uncharacterized protein n=1 Tax=Penicilliopsis zonata CBS 506.65 TaxID=1073090 RepID=A0A1L9SCD5_9EURO|nr:hypothetical protein ASPZODRAFT_738722 [Penicilliopsis zonata CBS 506.65]OJJ44778.1 hypothetical protein ASPZODRAFT_738722 [Penicilliopsis zonata CBS 506.65]
MLLPLFCTGRPCDFDSLLLLEKKRKGVYLLQLRWEPKNVLRAGGQRLHSSNNYCSSTFFFFFSCGFVLFPSSSPMFCL